MIGKCVTCMRGLQPFLKSNMARSGCVFRGHSSDGLPWNGTYLSYLQHTPFIPHTYISAVSPQIVRKMKKKINGFSTARTIARYILWLGTHIIYIHSPKYVKFELLKLTFWGYIASEKIKSSEKLYVPKNS